MFPNVWLDIQNLFSLFVDYQFITTEIRYKCKTIVKRLYNLITLIIDSISLNINMIPAV